MPTPVQVTQPASKRLGTPDDRQVTINVELFEDVQDDAEAIEKIAQRYGMDVARTRLVRQLKAEYGNTARAMLGKIQTHDNGEFASYEHDEDEIVTYFEEDAGNGKPWMPTVSEGADPTRGIRKKMKKLTPEQRARLKAMLEEGDFEDEEEEEAEAV